MQKTKSINIQEYNIISCRKPNQLIQEYNIISCRKPNQLIQEYTFDYQELNELILFFYVPTNSYK